MPEPANPKLHPHPAVPGGERDVARGDDERGAPAACAYAELHCLSNFSFLRGASHPEELVETAARLGYRALAITDRNSLAGVVRAHLVAREAGLKLILGAELTPVDAPPIVLLAPDRAAYGRLSRLITRGRLRARKGGFLLYQRDIVDFAAGLIGIVIPPRDLTLWSGASKDVTDDDMLHPPIADALATYRAAFAPPDLFLAAELAYDLPDATRLAQLREIATASRLPLVAANDVHYHVAERRYLQDVLTCVREGCTLAEAGLRLFPNAERRLRPLDEIARRYAAMPELLARTIEIADRCTFSLDELRYEYPHELCPAGMTPDEHLARLAWTGAIRRYDGSVFAVPTPDAATQPAEQIRAAARRVIPPEIFRLIDDELALIRDLKYEYYFLTVWDLVRYARSRGILCQGRGSAANSVVCFCLGVTSVDPARISLLFERFISRERNEPPDIDVDFEHERREEVLQYVYEKYGRERAALTAEVISYRARSAVRDIGKVLGLSLDRIDTLAKHLDWFDREALPEPVLRAAGVDPRDRTIRMLGRLVRQVLGFPRHLSQHVGGFVITQTPLCEIVPLENGAMPGRTFIEWDKDDIDALGILKVDCLALGMLTALSRCFEMLRHPAAAPANPPPTLVDIPPEDPVVYDMVCAADTVGVFQIESRAQMSMLPRLRPRCFYDLVIEVAIVRPGPIQGGMVHPYLRRRDGLEPVSYPSEAVRDVLAKTLGVPLFQEQVMKLAVVAAGFTPGEADQLRRAMAAWRRSGQIEKFQQKLFDGLQRNGYSQQFAEQIYAQIRGFGEYGFPESHAASFALLVYASCWLKKYFPAAFCAAVINSQPMGFYTPGQLIRDAQQHGVEVRPVDVNHSDWDCTLEYDARAAAADAATGPAIRVGLRVVRGLSAEKVAGIVAARGAGPIRSIHQLSRQPGVARDTLVRIAAADGFRSLGFDRRQAVWHILALDDREPPLLAELEPEEPPIDLPTLAAEERVAADYDAQGFSLFAHPIGLIRGELDALKVVPNARLVEIRHRQRVTVSGLVTVRQRPGTAKGTVFMTLEDETGMANLVVWPNVWDRYWRVARGRLALLATGRIERQGEVIHVMVEQLADLTQKLTALRHASRDFH